VESDGIEKNNDCSAQLEGDTSMKLMRRAILAMGLAISSVAAAADIDGTVPLTCTPSAGFDCSSEKACGKLKPESPPPPGGFKMDIDFANKIIKTPYHQTNLLPVQNTAINADQLILQGASDKFAWSSVVLRKSGKITITIADLKGAYVIFGQCKVAAPAG
jgi:hypothetical protein